MELFKRLKGSFADNQQDADGEYIEDEQVAESVDEDLSKNITNTAAAKNRSKAVYAGSNDSTNPSFVLVRPERFEDSINIANHIIDGKTVVLNLEATGKDLSRRIIDILSGTAYAVGAQIKNVSVGTYLIIPGGADFTGESNNMVDTSSFSI